MLFAEPVGGGIAAIPSRSQGPVSEIYIYGVGLEAPNTVRVLRDGVPQTILERTRNWVRIPITSNIPATFVLEVNAQSIGSFRFDGGLGMTYAPTDASTKGPGASASGGFFQLFRTDGQFFTCTESDDNEILVLMPIRKVKWANPRRIDGSFRRSYAGNNGGVETIEIYDWSTASYPYGSFVTVSTQNIASSGAQTINFSITTNPGRFIDPEGTVYVRVTTTAPGASASLSADSFRLTLK
jgi:hypothetical protein